MGNTTLERPQKILILGEAAAIHTHRWVDHFRRRGWTVRWLSFAPVDAGQGVEEIPIGSPNRGVAIWKVRAHVRTVIDSFKPDVISALFLPDYGWLACLTKRHPVAVSAWGSDVLLAPRKSILHKWRIQYVLRRADWLFGDADLLRERMVAMGADSNIITTVPLGVDDSWLEVGEKFSPSSTGPCNVITNRRLESLYRVDTFIRAAHDIEKVNPGAFRFTVVGDGSERGSLESLSRELGMQDHILFTGYLPEGQLQEAMAQAHIYVSCSKSDGTSVSLLEAMSAGAFPIVTDLAANREWITPGENGVLFPVGDHQKLAQVVGDVCEDAELVSRAREINREIVRSCARWMDNMREVEIALERLIARHQESNARMRAKP